MKLNNFKEAKITQNEDGTFKVEFYGVKFQDANENLEGRVTYPKIKVSTDDIAFSTYKQFHVEILADTNDEKTLFNISIQDNKEETYE